METEAKPMLMKLGVVSSSSDHTSMIVSLNLFVALLCTCIIIGHYLEKNRWINESITALIIVCKSSSWRHWTIFRYDFQNWLLFFRWYCRVYVLVVLSCLPLKERVHIYWYSVKTFSSSIFFHLSYSMQGKSSFSFIYCFGWSWNHLLTIWLVLKISSEEEAIFPEHHYYHVVWCHRYADIFCNYIRR